jgi:fluoroacetyl-CoA thioesterase
MTLVPGLKATARHGVAEMDLADRWGGEAAALASPIMIIFIEKTCMQATDHLLEPGQMTVGVKFDIDHLAPTPPSWEVTVESELISVQDRTLTYRVTVHDAAGKVGEGTHARFIVHKDRFHERLHQRASSVLADAGAN